MNEKKMIEAIRFAVNAHQSTNHLYDGLPYIVHLSMVVNYATKYSHLLPSKDCKGEVIAACWLHDTIEDCRVTYNDLKKVVGENIANIVYAVTNEKGKTRGERANDKYYKEMRQEPWACFVKMCDRLANVSYGLQSNSSMFFQYKEENEEFIKKLFPTTFAASYHREMIDDLNEMLNQNNKPWPSV